MMGLYTALLLGASFTVSERQDNRISYQEFKSYIRQMLNTSKSLLPGRWGSAGHGNCNPKPCYTGWLYRADR